MTFTPQWSGIILDQKTIRDAGSFFSQHSGCETLMNVDHCASAFYGPMGQDEDGVNTSATAECQMCSGPTNGCASSQ